MFQNLLLTGYELLSALLPFSVFLWVYARHSRKRGAPLSGTELAAMLLFGLYIAAVLYYTGSGTLFDLLRYGFSLRPGQVNLLPFSRQIDWMGYFLNLLLFVPLGGGAALPLPGSGRLAARPLRRSLPLAAHRAEPAFEQPQRRC